MALLTHNRRIGSLCRRHCRDLSIAEMLSDTIVQALMEADGIEPEILAAQLRGIAQQISAARREDKKCFCNW